jgi:predicted nuclease of predicted toxin-antitoxin system
MDSPKIVWIRTGNLTTNDIADLLKANKDAISEFINNPEQEDLTCLEIE